MSHDDFPTDDPAVVTCGLPYANGDLHIGHLRTYVGGDVYRRALERLGQETAFVSGSDMHGTPVAVNAEQEGVSPSSSRSTGTSSTPRRSRSSTSSSTTTGTPTTRRTRR